MHRSHISQWGITLWDLWDRFIKTAGICLHQQCGQGWLRVPCGRPGNPGKIKVFMKSHGKSWNFENASKVMKKSWNFEATGTAFQSALCLSRLLILVESLDEKQNIHSQQWIVSMQFVNIIMKLDYKCDLIFVYSDPTMHYWYIVASYMLLKGQ